MHKGRGGEGRLGVAGQLQMLHRTEDGPNRPTQLSAVALAGSPFFFSVYECEQMDCNLIPRPPAQTLSRSRGEISRSRGSLPPTFLHGCEIKSGREAAVEAFPRLFSMAVR